MATQGTGSTNSTNLLTKFERVWKWVKEWWGYLTTGIVLSFIWVLWAHFGHPKISIAFTKKPEIFTTSEKNIGRCPSYPVDIKIRLFTNGLKGKVLCKLKNLEKDEFFTDAIAIEFDHKDSIQEFLMTSFKFDVAKNRVIAVCQCEGEGILVDWEKAAKPDIKVELDCNQHT